MIDPPEILLSWCIRAAKSYYAWISKLLPDVAFQYMAAERAIMLIKKVTYFGEFGYLNSSCIPSYDVLEKVLF